MKHGLKVPRMGVCVVLLLSLLLPSTGTAKAETAGQFIFVQGKVSVIRGTGPTGAAQKGQTVREGDTVVSGKQGYAQLVMRDGGYIAIRPDTRLRIDVFLYQGREDGTERSVFSLLRGGFRAITGAIGRTNKENYKIKTPVAIIGIRGTDHEPMFIPAPSEGEISPAQPGVYDRVSVGQAYIENEAGRVFINANEVGYAPDAVTEPVRLGEIPGVYRSLPAASGGKKEDEAGEQETVSGPEGPEGPASPDGSSSDWGEPESAGNRTFATGGSGATDSGFEDTIVSDATGQVAAESIINQPVKIQDSTIDLTDPSTVVVSAYRVVGFASWDPRSPTPPHTVVEGMFNTLDRVATDSAGHIVGFDGNLPVIGGSYEDRDPVRLGLGGATLVNAGLDTETGISWGRWTGGTISATSLASGAPVSPAFNPADVHYIAGPEMTNAIVLPITGTYSYTLVGGTNPTDQLGNVGVLNGASLTAHFDQMTVDAGVNVTVGMVTLDASANGIPILDASSRFSLNRAGPSFAAGMNEPTSLNVNCSGPGCGTTNNGILSGGFVGPGGNAAGMAYSLNTNDGATIDTTISGVAAFKKE